MDPNGGASIAMSMLDKLRATLQCNPYRSTAWRFDAIHPCRPCQDTQCQLGWQWQVSHNWDHESPGPNSLWIFSEVGIDGRCMAKVAKTSLYGGIYIAVYSDPRNRLDLSRPTDKYRNYLENPSGYHMLSPQICVPRSQCRASKIIFMWIFKGILSLEGRVSKRLSSMTLFMDSIQLASKSPS